MVLNVVLGDDTQTFESEDGAPIQWKARASYLSACRRSADRSRCCREQPQLQPVLGRHVEHVVRRDHAADALHVHTTAGLPATCRPKWRATKRA